LTTRKAIPNLNTFSSNSYKGLSEAYQALHDAIQDAERGVQGEEGQRALEELPPLASSLVYSGHKSPFQSEWTKTQRRLYHRTLSGFEFAKRFGDQIRVLTLTSSPDSPDIHHSFEVFKKRIRRKFGRFEYLSVKEHTKDGLVHLHICYRGCFMPQSWLSASWNEIHRAKIVYIAKLRSWNLAKHLARYFIKEGFGRFWSSWSWVYRGYLKDWKKIVSRHGLKAIAYWHVWLRGWSPSVSTTQGTFNKYTSEILIHAKAIHLRVCPHVQLPCPYGRKASCNGCFC